MAGQEEDEIARIVRSLTGEPVAPLEATPPAQPGLYAWWAIHDHLSDASPAIPPVLIGADGWSLFYIGIAPSRLTSGRDLADRVGDDHMNGNIGGSTFRHSLAALLRESLALEPLSGYDRSRLADETPLTSWMNKNCGLTLVVAPEPWHYEKTVIARLGSPLNIIGGIHPFRREVQAARSALRRDCGLG